MRVAIRADGGPELGYGHLVRSGALATELRNRGYSVVYLTATPEIVRGYFPANIEVSELGAPGEGDECARKLEKLAVDAIITDSYEVDGVYQQELLDSVDTLAVFQASDEYTLHCDILINSHLFASELKYKYIGKEPIWCLGLDYVLLREEFNRLARKEPLWRETPERALIIMGGSDVNNSTPAAMQAFNNYDITVDVVIGPGYTNSESIEQTAVSLDCEFMLHKEPDNLAQLMFDADFAVSALGTTVYELFTTNTPILGVSQVKNQKRIARVIQQEGLGIIVDSADEFPGGVGCFMSDPSVRRKIFRSYRGLIDGAGPRRVVDTLTNQSPLE